MTKIAYKIAKDNLNIFLKRLSLNYELYAPTGENHVKFRKITNPKDIAILPYRTKISLKSLFFPPRETLFTWRKENGNYVICNSLREERENVIFGARGCDIKAIYGLDRYMLGEFNDPYYKAKRNVIVIGITCEHPRDSCFCTLFGSMRPEEYDLWITDLGSCYLVEVGSERGRMIIFDDIFTVATAEEIELADEKIKNIEKGIMQKIKDLNDINKIIEIIKEKFEDPIWLELGEICLACGRCNFICPTCHCFDIEDFTNIPGTEGKRVRVWDSCHLYEYARTSAENFRKERYARIRYRIYDKFVFSAMRYGIYACTGCGRCIEECPAGIDIRNVLRRLIS